MLAAARKTRSHHINAAIALKKQLHNTERLKYESVSVVEKTYLYLS